MKGVQSSMRKVLVLSITVALVVANASAGEIPVESDSTFILPAFLTGVVTGAPADSLMLRVSFYSRPGDGRFDTWAFIVVEELLWPPAPHEVRIDLADQGSATSRKPQDPQVVLEASRIEGGFLNRTRRETVGHTPAPGMRAGEVGGHWVHPFEFVEWVNPLRFVVTDGRGRFEISWVGRGRFELVAVEGVR
jgi:hypothetical protein